MLDIYTEEIMFFTSCGCGCGCLAYCGCFDAYGGPLYSGLKSSEENKRHADLSQHEYEKLLG